MPNRDGTGPMGMGAGMGMRGNRFPQGQMQNQGATPNGQRQGCRGMGGIGRGMGRGMGKGMGRGLASGNNFSETKTP
ncbi:MAG TPA: hypothetical protein VLM37_10750 [Fibrobacteraceae bacterium]|nr:hypothetical protein [Fibrobacteraceae bacterium]